MISGSIARRYARAMLEIGVSNNSYEALGREVNDVAQAMRASAELHDALCNPVFKRSERARLLDKVLTRLGVSKTTRNFFSLLLDRERINAAPDIARELSAMIDDKAKRVKAVVTSAKPLTALQLQQIKLSLEQVSGKTVAMDNKEDPELLGGVVAQVGDTVYDGSIRSQLERMRARLVQKPQG